MTSIKGRLNRLEKTFGREWWSNSTEQSAENFVKYLLRLDDERIEEILKKLPLEVARYVREAMGKEGTS